MSGKTTVRLSLDVSHELNATLEDMGGSKSEVLRRSIALMEVAVGAIKDGHKVGVGPAVEREFVLL
jgi:hypothetical protein